MGVEDPWNILAYSWSVPVSKLIQENLANFSIRQLRDFSLEEKLRRWGLYEKLEWTVEETILVWHIATDLYLFWYNTDGTTTLLRGEQQNQDAAEAVQALSNYMLFLLAARPYMLPPGTSREAYVQMCYVLLPLNKPRVHKLPSLDYTSAEDLARSLLCLGKSLNTGSSPVELQIPRTRVIGRSDSAMAIPAAQLGAKLVREEAGSSSPGSVLKLIFQVWVYMLLDMGSRCSAYSHANQLSNGGELVTVAALQTKYQEAPYSL
jgi:hypothetical protein